MTETTMEMKHDLLVRSVCFAGAVLTAPMALDEAHYAWYWLTIAFLLFAMGTLKEKDEKR